MPDNYDSLKLKNQLCFPLYACAKEIVKAYKPYLDKLNLTYTQYITMMVMWEHKSLREKELGEYLYLDSSTLTPLLKRLEDKGFISRRRSKEDERGLIVTITENGDDLKEKAKKVPQLMASCVRFDSEKSVLLYNLLYELLGNLTGREMSRSKQT